MTCSCIGVEIGSYDNQIRVNAPIHMPKDNGYCIDRCIYAEVLSLWNIGIITTGCCCGHKKLDGYIGVIKENIPKMLEMQYTQLPDKPDHFYPLSIKKAVA